MSLRICISIVCTHVGDVRIIRAQMFGWTALIHAVWKGRADCARLLLDAGADKNAMDKVRVSVGSGVLRVGRKDGDEMKFGEACHLQFCF